MPAAADGPRSGRFQSAWLGSFGRASGLRVMPSSGLAIAATLWPTTPRKGTQGIVALHSERWHVALMIGAEGGATVEVSEDGRTTFASVAAPMQPRRWYDVAASLAPDGTLRVAQRARRALGSFADSGEAQAHPFPLPAGGICDATLAALPPDGSGAPAHAHFNGKLERPTIWEGTDAIDAVLARQLDPVPRPGAPGLLAGWDFSQAIPTQTAADLGPRAAHARLVNLPSRAMTGATWDGSVQDWTRAPEQVRCGPFPRRRPGRSRLAGECLARHPARLAERSLQRACPQRRGRGFHPVLRAAGRPAQRRRVPCSHLHVSSLRLLRASRTRCGDRRARRILGRAA